MKALIYRELILCRKNLAMVIGFIGVAGFMLLVQLSFEIGNLSKFNVIANQCAHWCGNPFPLQTKGLRVP